MSMFQHTTHIDANTIAWKLVNETNIVREYRLNGWMGKIPETLDELEETIAKDPGIQLEFLLDGIQMYKASALDSGPRTLVRLIADSLDVGYALA